MVSCKTLHLRFTDEGLCVIQLVERPLVKERIVLIALAPSAFKYSYIISLLNAVHRIRNHKFLHKSLLVNSLIFEHPIEMPQMHYWPIR